MKLARIEIDGAPSWVEIDGADYYTVRRAENFSVRHEKITRIEPPKLLAPIEPHNKIIGLLDNFSGKKERNGPGLFLKATSSAIAHEETIIRPEAIPAFNFEAELAVVIGKKASRVSQQDALQYVLGYTIGNDVTSFPALMEDGPASLSTRFKMCDTFMPLGPWIVTDLDPNNLALRSYLNGELKQNVSTKDMAFTVAEVIAWITAVVTLNPGDVISMGTPPGFVEMESGDVILCEIESIGQLRNPVVC